MSDKSLLDAIHKNIEEYIVRSLVGSRCPWVARTYLFFSLLLALPVAMAVAENDQLGWLKNFVRANDGKEFCVPPGTQFRDFADVISGYKEAHPELDGIIGGQSAFAAFKKAYPCQVTSSVNSLQPTLLNSEAIVVAPQEKYSTLELVQRYMDSFCFHNSYPSAPKDINGVAKQFTVEFSRLEGIKMIRGTRVFVLSNDDLRDLHFKAYAEYLDRNELEALLSFCRNENIALKTALEKRRSILLSRQMASVLRESQMGGADTARLFASAMDGKARSEESSMTNADRAVLAAFDDSTVAQAAIKKISEQISPQISKAIAAMGRKIGAETLH